MTRRDHLVLIVSCTIASGNVAEGTSIGSAIDHAEDILSEIEKRCPEFRQFTEEERALLQRVAHMQPNWEELAKAKKEAELT